MSARALELPKISLSLLSEFRAASLLTATAPKLSILGALRAHKTDFYRQCTVPALRQHHSDHVYLEALGAKGIADVVENSVPICIRNRDVVVR